MASSGSAVKQPQTREMASPITGEHAPEKDSLPTSSWSKRAIIATSVSVASSAEAAWLISASIAVKQWTWLSVRGEETNSSFMPQHAAGCVSQSVRSKSWMSPTAHPSSLAISVRNAGL